MEKYRRQRRTCEIVGGTAVRGRGGNLVGGTRTKKENWKEEDSVQRKPRRREAEAKGVKRETRCPKAMENEYPEHHAWS